MNYSWGRTSQRNKCSLRQDCIDNKQILENIFQDEHPPPQTSSKILMGNTLMDACQIVCSVTTAIEGCFIKLKNQNVRGRSGHGYGWDRLQESPFVNSHDGKH